MDMGCAGRYTQRFPGQLLVELLQYVQRLWEELLMVWPVGVFTDELAIDMDVKYPVFARDQLEGPHVVTQASQNFARHPEGAKSVLSTMAILDAYVQFFRCHASPPIIDKMYSNSVLAVCQKTIRHGQPSSASWHG